MPCTSFRLSSYGISDIGLHRPNNEDSFAEVPHLHFYTLADGMGGHKAGEVAAHEAVSCLCETISHHLVDLDDPKYSPGEMKELLRSSIKEVNEWIYTLGKAEKSFQGMGTTLCATLFYDEELIFAHVGDSRIYRFRNNCLDRLTEDHSLKKIQARNVLTKAIGTSTLIDPDVSSIPLQTGDLFLLCTDGLTDFVSEPLIHALLKKKLSLERTADQLIHAAYAGGGADNITVLFIQVT